MKRARFGLLVAALSLASLYIGLQQVAFRPGPPVHPLTGRQIAGIATDSRLARTATETPARCAV